MNHYLYGLHDPGGEYLFADRKGWVVFTEEVGADPADKSGRDYRPWSDAGYGVLVRINNGYGSAGTIPPPGTYMDFARRVGNFIAASNGCDTWIIGNEPNHAQERPNGQAITPPMYIACFKAVHESVRTQAGTRHGLIPAPVALWNVETGDWLEYQATIWKGLWRLSAGVALHTYSHGASPALITSTEKMGVPYQDRFYHFQAYRDLMTRVPTGMRGLPVYITETDQNDPWVDANTGWVQAAYAEIDRWNKTDGTQKIHCLCLYRWPMHDRWSIVDKPGVHADLRAAVAKGYKSPQINAQNYNKPIYLPDISTGTQGIQPESPRDIDPRATQRGVSIVEIAPKAGETIWRVKSIQWLDEQQSQGRHHIYADLLDEQGNRVVGVPLLVTWPSGNTRIVTEAKPGEPYAANFPMSPSRNEFAIAVVDGTPSEMVRGIGMGAETPGGFNAGIHTSTVVTFQRVKVPAVSQPQPAQPVTVPMLAHPIADPAKRIISQRFGDNPGDYAKFGIPAHNGLDIASPLGTPIMSVADGTVAYVGTDVDYGNYVRITHPQLGFDSFYAHLQQAAVRVGQAVRQGEKIGLMGSTGNSTGSHLHLEFRLTNGNSYAALSGGYGKGRFDPAIAYWLLNREVI